MISTTKADRHQVDAAEQLPGTQDTFHPVVPGLPHTVVPCRNAVQAPGLHSSPLCHSSGDTQLPPSPGAECLQRVVRHRLPAGPGGAVLHPTTTGDVDLARAPQGKLGHGGHTRTQSRASRPPWGAATMPAAQCPGQDPESAPPSDITPSGKLETPDGKRTLCGFHRSFVFQVHFSICGPHTQFLEI